MKKPHKHAELIKAWADGVEIQVRIPFTERWEDTSTPQWCTSNQYRIKPEEKKPVVRWLWVLKNQYGLFHSTYFFSEEEAKDSGLVFKLEWSRTEFPE